MIEFIYKLLLTFNATSPIIVTFLIKDRYYFNVLGKFPVWISYMIFIIVAIALTGLTLVGKRFLSYDSIEDDPIDVEQANNTFLPSYLGYFFVALSVTSVETFIFIYAMVFIFTFVSQTLYFNPIFLLFGYKFYYITTKDNVKVFIISKKIIKTTRNLQFQSLRRINDFTFIDEQKGD
ncbi:MAG: hypothetical protein RR128_07300 [Clostridium sp.]